MNYPVAKPRGIKKPPPLIPPPLMVYRPGRWFREACPEQRRRARPVRSDRPLYDKPIASTPQDRGEFQVKKDFLQYTNYIDSICFDIFLYFLAPKKAQRLLQRPTKILTVVMIMIRALLFPPTPSGEGPPKTGPSKGK